VYLDRLDYFKKAIIWATTVYFVGGLVWVFLPKEKTSAVGQK